VKGFIMKLLTTIVASLFVLTAQAQTPNKPAEPTKAEAPKELVLAKKKDHSKDKKVDATKSPSQGSKAETTKK
jgi:hypothetical protein